MEMERLISKTRIRLFLEIKIKYGRLRKRPEHRLNILLLSGIRDFETVVRCLCFPVLFPVLFEVFDYVGFQMLLGVVNWSALPFLLQIVSFFFVNDIGNCRIGGGECKNSEVGEKGKGICLRGIVKASNTTHPLAVAS